MPKIGLDTAMYWVIITLLFCALYAFKLELKFLQAEVRQAKEKRPATTIIVDEENVPKLKSK